MTFYFSRQSPDYTYTAHVSKSYSAHVAAELREVERKIFARQRLLAFIAVGSLILGCIVNELCAGDDYQETAPDSATLAFFADPNREPRPCSAALATPLKLVQSAITVCLLLMIMARFRLRVHQTHVIQHLKDRQVLMWKTKERKHVKLTAGVMMELAGELVLCCVHTVPFLAMDIKNEALGRELYYRIESLLCGFMFVRLYHVYLWQEQSVFLKYFDLEDSYLIKDFKTIKLTQECSTSHRTLAFKVAMTRNPGAIIMTIVALLLSSTTYIVRIAEGPAAMPHSKYMWNQLWVTLTQATTGYGESVPVTHIGRAAVVVVMLFMPLIIAFITASTTKSLNLTPDEVTL